MDLTSQFAERLRSAGNDDQARAVATAELLLLSVPTISRNSLTQALDAAVVLRWFDAELLGRVLEIDADACKAVFESLRTLPFIENFRDRQELLNVHELTRLGWRKKLFREDPVRFGALSRNATEYFIDCVRTERNVEQIYHLLSAEPNRGANELARIDWYWTQSSWPQHYYALAAALKELVDSAIVEGRARLWCSLIMAQAQGRRDGFGKLSIIADEILASAVTESDERAIVLAFCLKGDALEANDKNEEALAAFNTSLDRCLSASKSDPCSVIFKWDAAGVYNKIGSLLEDQEKLTEARTILEDALRIARDLAQAYPQHDGWQENLAFAYRRIGQVLGAQGFSTEATSALLETLKIAQALVELNPSDLRRRRNLAVAHRTLGMVFESQGKFTEAMAALGQSLRIANELVLSDPTNTSAQRNLGLAYRRIGDVLRAQGKATEARSAYDEFLRITRRLIDVDPRNHRWRRDLMVAERKAAAVREHPESKT